MPSLHRCLVLLSEIQTTMKPFGEQNGIVKRILVVRKAAYVERLDIRRRALLHRQVE